MTNLEMIENLKREIASLTAEVEALWDYVGSPPEDPDEGAYNEATAFRDKRLYMGLTQ